MSYGVLSSRPAQALVETAGLSGRGESSPAHGLDHFNNLFGTAWVSGRVTLTRRHLTFVPHAPNLAARPTERMLEMDLAEIDEVSVTGGLVGGKVLSARSGERLLRLKCRNAAGLADQIRAASGPGGGRRG